MNERSRKISKLKSDSEARVSYMKAKLNVNMPSQIRALRRRRQLTQSALAERAGMKQSRISAMERPGETNFNVDTLVRLAAAYEVGLIVKFAPYSEVLDWENGFSQDTFDVVEISKDIDFLEPAASYDSSSTQLDVGEVGEAGVLAIPVQKEATQPTRSLEPGSARFHPDGITLPTSEIGEYRDAA